MTRLGLEQVEGRALRYEQQPREHLRAFDVKMAVRERRFPVVTQVLVELRVVLFASPPWVNVARARSLG